MTFTRPMLAASLLPNNIEHTDENILKAMQQLRYPVLATLKKDGIRAIKLGELASRTLKKIPNLSIQKRAEKLPSYFDMELWNPELQYDEVESIVMSREHKDSDKIQFHLLDWVGQHVYGDRYYLLQKWLANHQPNAIWFKGQREIVIDNYCEARTPDELFRFFISCEQEDGEGICFRTPDSPYKQGRSTLREQYLVKLARFHRTELKIIGFKEQVMNTNSEKRNPIGMMARRKTVGGFGKNTLGAFVCQNISDGTLVDVGTGVGLTDAFRKEIWFNQTKYLNKQITVKHKPHGKKNKLRAPIFVGFREEGF